MAEKVNIFSLERPENFEKVFKEYFQPLCYYSVRLVGDMDAAKDIVHNVFVKLWERRSEIHHDKPLRSYLFTSVHNRSLNHLRDHSRFEARDISEIPLGSDLTADDHSNVENAELESKIASAIRSLPENCREIFRMSRMEGMKYREIAVALNISVKTVEARMSTALRQLRDELKDYLKVFALMIMEFFRQIL